MNKFADIVNTICASGEWKVSYPHWGLDCRNRVERLSDGFYLNLHTGGTRLTVSNYEVDDKITISLSKPVDVIVNEISKRIVQPNKEAWAKHLAEKEQERLDAEQHQANMKRLCEAAGTKLSRYDKYSFSAPTYPTGANLHSCQVNSDSVYLTLRNIPFDMAEKIFLILQGKDS